MMNKRFHSTFQLVLQVGSSYNRLVDLNLQPDLNFIPCAATSISIFILGFQIFHNRFRRGREDTQAAGSGSLLLSSNGSRLFRSSLREKNNRKLILSSRIVHLLGNILLLSVALYHWSLRDTTLESWAGFVPRLCAIYTYTTVLSTTALLTSGKWSRVAAQHAKFVLLVVLSNHIYRNIWPLATYTRHPLDRGAFVWVNLTLLVITSVVIPLFTPRKHVSHNQKEPDAINPEKTASNFSLATFSFLNPVISGAGRGRHLSNDDLPPLCNEDESTKLMELALPLFHPLSGAANHTRIVWSLLSIFRWDYFRMAIYLIIQTISSFAAPIAINRLVAALEVGSSSSTIRPWLWVLLLFIGPLSVSLSFQQYSFAAGKVSVRMKAILTQLLLEQSLRTRVNATTSDEGLGHQSSDDSDSDTENHSKSKVNFVGRLNTLVTVDMENIVAAKEFLMVVLQTPLELSLAIAFLYTVLDWSAFVGLGCIAVLSPVPGYIARKIQSISKRKMEKTDARVEATTEFVGVLRMIKMFGWGKKMKESLDTTREEELKWIFKDKMTILLNNVVNYCIPILTMLATFGSYTLIAKQPLTPSKVFSSMAVIDVVRNLLHRTSWVVGDMMRANVSLKRVEEYLYNTDILEDLSAFMMASTNDGSVDEIEIQDTGFHWSNGKRSGDVPTPSESFMLQVNGRLTFKKNAINLIIGSTGSGKTSLLMALLGEMQNVQLQSVSWFKFPRTGGIAYAAQESWVQNATIRENILFGTPFDEERYRKVLYQCCLDRDFALFTAGDQTEVGEQGITLSGGQKARITLARAVYSNAQTVLLDDILAALDVQTAAHIVKECFQGDVLSGRTVLLVTHNITLTAPIADCIVTIDASGKVHEAENVQILVEQEQESPKQNGPQQEQYDEEKKFINPELTANGTLILSEDVDVGHVSWSSIRLLLSTLGGAHPVVFFVSWILGIVLMHTSSTAALWYLGVWGTQYETKDPSDAHVSRYLGTYAAVLLSGVVIYGVAATIFHRGSQRASRMIYSRLIDSVLSATFRWLDETPTSRILARCTQDIGSVDITLAWAFYQLAELLVFMLLKLGGPTIFTPIFLLPAFVALAFGWHLGSIYLKVQLPVKRQLGKASAPILAHVNATLHGLVSIRAFGVQQRFKKQSMEHIDNFTRLSRTSLNLNSWIAIRSDFIGAALPALLATYLISTKNVAAANTGFSLTTSVEFCAGILWLARSWNEFEVVSNSLERIRAYLNIEHESKDAKLKNLPGAWPKSGELNVQRLSARYSKEGSEILHDLTFHVNSGERIGIIGRTGSGKSSLTLSLLRCILVQGEVLYDGVRTSDIDIEVLRSNITIIPQVPELLNGTLRRNLDPFEQYDDMVLHHALRDAGFYALQLNEESARLTLDSKIASGGKNLSIGQKQIIALARALVRDSKILILDEATSSIDHETDNIIQKSLRQNGGTDRTALIVAHRLKTIMDADKVMVLDEGCIVQYDSPKILPQQDGLFKEMVDASEDKAVLYSIANMSKSP
ncbi:hypothetical protein CPB83DRAFT_865377 [Crepidotus variabilis]|uniref:P-loop containing nucleoside triphosphate hydrolase protein n=1 Tax=Crepidotus variabilis TaxID=179855 RepID=A0A9P6E340_9AGAR|nr:hypothetical protein CPB83DRAFT_865377 [Crepidotus variabilis]